jgi:hypothetical protein
MKTDRTIAWKLMRNCPWKFRVWLPFAAIVPKAELLMLYCGLLGCGRFMTLVASTQS